MTTADWWSGCSFAKKLMWFVSTRSHATPAPATAISSRVTRTTPRACRIEKCATRRIGPARCFSCGATPDSGFSSISSVGTKTSDSTKSTITPTAEPTPNDRTATTSLVASEARPSAVGPLAPSSGANRCWTLDTNACSLLPVSRSSWLKCCTMWTSSATARISTSGGIMLARML